MVSIYRGRSTTEFYLASVLYDSIEDLDRRAVVALIKEKGADANIVLPRRGIAPFHQVIANEDREFAMETTLLILQHGGDPNVRSDEGLTPLHIAAAWGRLELVRLLLYSGADPNLEDNSYMMPIDYAKEEHHEDVVALIRDAINANIQAIFEAHAGRDRCTLKLNKIVVRNGQAVGEYEVVQSELEKQAQAPAAIDLKVLPQTTPNEYVRNWFNSLENWPKEASFDETVVRSPNFANVTVRRPVVHLDSTYSGSSGTSECPGTLSQMQITQSDCNKSHISRESGIQTLPNSMLEEYDQGKPTSSSPPLRKTSKDTSSDYYTCTEVSDGVDEHDPHNNAFIFSASNDAEMSFVSVSEVYKYEDTEKGVCIYEKRVLPNLLPNLNETENYTTISSKSSKVSSLPVTFDYDTDALRNELTRVGFEPGPITKTTKRVYLRKLRHFQKHPHQEFVVTANDDKPRRVYSNEVQKTLHNPEWTQDLTAYRLLEEAVVKQFAQPDPTRHWREGISKTSFTYLLLDPRITQNLPGRADSMSFADMWKVFLGAIFYVGKGKRSRPYQHLYDAIDLHKRGGTTSPSTKLQRILDIWGDAQGVVCLHLFQNVIPVEAFTREAAMLTAMKLDNLANVKTGEFYGVAATWSSNQKQMLGVYLLYKALRIFLNEGERQLSPNDID